jgi:cytochrome c peroxidase
VDGVAKALASFERTLLSGSSLWDRHLVAIKAGVPEQSPLSPAQKRGLDLFYGKARCASCHGGPDLTDHDFHNVGVGIQDGRLIDAGRFKVVRSELVGHVDASLTGAFKTPTLRDIARTAPYMHDGSLQTLREVMAYFNGGITSNPHLDEQLTADGRMGTAPRMLGLSQDELADLEQFLLALTGEPIVIDPPQLPGSEPAAAVDHAPRSKQTTTSRSAQAGGG